MHVLAVELRFRIPQSQSLKEKRSVLNSLMDRLGRLGVSVAEIADPEDHQLATLGVATVSGSVHVAESNIDEVVRMVWSRPEVEVLDEIRTWMELDQ